MERSPLRMGGTKTLVAGPLPVDDAKELVGEILRRVDHLIKAGDLDESIREIIRAKEIDPKHGYIRAYEERLAYLKEEHEKNIAQEQTRKAAEEAARKRDDELRRKREEEQKRLEEERKQKEAERRKEDAEATTDDERDHAQKAEQENPGPKIEETKNTISENDGRSSHGSGGVTILVVEDDEQLLQMISQALGLAGYAVRSITSSDEAYVLLKKWAPDLILCDVNLETSSMGGLSFYQKIRTLDHLHQVPFIFLTGLNDEVVLRTAKELGADDYLLKPISIEHLLSTIKGKLKRFGTFRRKI